MTHHYEVVVTRAFAKKEWWRWLLAAAAVGAAFYATLYASVLLVIGGSPRDATLPAAGFLIVSTVVLAGALLAPRGRFAVALCLWLAGFIALGSILGREGAEAMPGALAGGLAAVGFVAWRIHPRRTARAARFMGIGAGAVAVVFVGFVYARYKDWPARADAMPAELTKALGPDAGRVAAFYSYDRGGGFLDTERLWRIDAPPEVIALVVSSFRLRVTDAIPREFWRMPPYYWPRVEPAHGEAFQSPGFSADTPGPEGDYYFLLYDRTQERAFVWVKDNF